jgi:hypothetical protein
LVTLWSSAITQWLRANRRYFGLSFAVSHAWHAIAIIWISVSLSRKNHQLQPRRSAGLCIHRADGGDLIYRRRLIRTP